MYAESLGSSMSKGSSFRVWLTIKHLALLSYYTHNLCTIISAVETFAVLCVVPDKQLVRTSGPV